MVRFNKNFAAGIFLCLAAGCRPSEPAASDSSTPPATTPVSPVIKISALASGEILLDGKPCSSDELKTRLAAGQKNNGLIYYFREAADQEPHPNAMKAMQLIVDSRLPVSLSTRPDFADYVDANGHSNPRP
jgi:biopolymer transport protein ExbD